MIGMGKDESMESNVRSCPAVNHNANGTLADMNKLVN